MRALGMEPNPGQAIRGAKRSSGGNNPCGPSAAARKLTIPTSQVKNSRGTEKRGPSCYSIVDPIRLGRGIAGFRGPWRRGVNRAPSQTSSDTIGKRFRDAMPEVMFAGPDGRLEGRYHHSKEAGAPVALILHPHPLHGGTMNNRMTYAMYQSFQRLGCSVMRVHFRGVGRSQGRYDGGIGEVSDAA